MRTRFEHFLRWRTLRMVIQTVPSAASTRSQPPHSRLPWILPCGRQETHSVGASDFPVAMSLFSVITGNHRSQSGIPVVALVATNMKCQCRKYFLKFSKICFSTAVSAFKTPLSIQRLHCSGGQYADDEGPKSRSCVTESQCNCVWLCISAVGKRKAAVQLDSY